VERIDPIDVEFLINSDEVKQDSKRVKDDINGIGDTADNVTKKVNGQLGGMLDNSTNKINTQAAAVGRSKSQWNGLGNSINQISRELPAFTYSAQTGFLALSNNIPILADEIGRLRVQNEALVASGAKGVPIWKSVLQNLFSWNVALSLGVTLVTIYGDEIAAFLKKLFNGQETIDATTSRVEALNRAYESNSYQKAIQGVTEVRAAFTRARQDVDKKDAALKTYNKTLGKSLGIANNYNQAEDLFIKKSGAYVKALLARATASELAQEASKKLTELLKEDDRISREIDDIGGSKTINTFLTKDLRKERNEVRREAKEVEQTYTRLLNQVQNQIDFIENKFKINNEKEETGIRKQLTDRKKLLEQILELDREYSRKQLNEDEAELDALKEKFDKARKLIQEFNADPKNAKVKIDVSLLDPIEQKAIETVTYDQQTKALKKEIEAQKSLFREFEEFRKTFGISKARERYEGEIGEFENYRQYIQSKISQNNSAFEAVAYGTNTLGQGERVDILSKEADDERKLQEQHLDGLLAGFLSYEQERAKIIENYNEIRQQLNDKEGFDADKLDREFDQELQKLDQAKVEIDARYKALYGDLKGLGDKAIQQIIVKAREMVDALAKEGKVSAEIIKSIYAQIDAVENSKSGKQADRLRELAFMFQEVGNSISGVFGELINDIADTVGLLSNALQVMNSDTASGLTKVTSMIGLFTTAYNLLNKAVEFLNRDKELENQISLNKSKLNQIKIEEQINELHRDRNELIREANVLIDSYYKDDYASAISKQREMLDTMQASVDALSSGASIQGTGRTSGFFGLGAKDKDYNFNIDKVIGYLTGATGIGINPNNEGSKFDAFLDTADGVSKVLESMGKTAQDVAKFSSQEWMDFFELLDASGRVTEETTKALLDTARQAIEEYQAALEDMRNIIKNFAGELSTQLSSSLQDAFRTGEDAAEHFRKSINKVLLNIFMQDLINQQFRQFFNSLQDEMEASMGVGGDQNWIDDIKRFSDQISPRLDAAMEAMKIFDDELQAAGYEGFGKDDTSTATGLQGAIRREMTEETASELTGLFRGQYDITKKHFQLSERWFVMEQKCCDATMSIMASNALIEENTRNTVIQVMYAVAELKTISKQTKSASGRDLGKPGG
tara:strand:+ start:24209 stop:27625 length:3417 start_codon:yes stop_codon:yes gene_type:complete